MPDQYDKNKYIFWRTLIKVKKGLNHLREDFKKTAKKMTLCKKGWGVSEKNQICECIIKSDISLRDAFKKKRVNLGTLSLFQSTPPPLP